MNQSSRLHWRSFIGALLFAVAVSWWRWQMEGTLRVDGIWPLWRAYIPPALGAVPLGVMARWYLGAVRALELPTLPVLRQWALVATGVAALALPLTSNDLFMNVLYGHLSVEGLNPYTDLPRALGLQDPFVLMAGPHWLDMPMCYGPLMAWVAHFAARVGTVAGAMVLFKLCALAAVLVAFYAAYDICKFLPEPSGRRTFLLFALSPAILWELAAQAHNDVFILAACTLFAWAATRQRHALATVFLALALAVKASVLPLAGLYVVFLTRRSWRMGAGAALGLLSVYIAAALPFWTGPETLRGLVTVLLGENGGTTAAVSHSFVELFFHLAYFLGPQAQYIVYRAGWALGLLLLGGVAVYGVTRVRKLSDVAHYALLFYLTYCFTTTWFQGWYVTWLLPLMLLQEDRRWQWIVALYTAITPVACAIHLDPVPTLVVNVVVLIQAYRVLQKPSSYNPLASTGVAALET